MIAEDGAVERRMRSPLVQCCLRLQYGPAAAHEFLQALRMTIPWSKPPSCTCIHVVSLGCLYPRSAAVPTFLRSCAREFPALNLAHRDSGRIYAHFERGRLAWMDRTAMDTIEDLVTLGALRLLAPGLFGGSVVSSTESARWLGSGQCLTLGR